MTLTMQMSVNPDAEPEKVAAALAAFVVAYCSTAKVLAGSKRQFVATKESALFEQEIAELVLISRAARGDRE